jgi:methyl-accepting chemotaxis protein
VTGPLSRWRRVWWAAGIAALTVVVAGTILMTSARGQMEREAERELLMLMSLRLAALETGLEQLGSEMVLWSDFGRLKESLGLYAAAFQELGPNAGEILRRRYVTESPYPEGERHLLADAGDGSTYSRLHAERIDGVRDFLSIHAYYDVFMIDADGDVVYSYFKESDFGTNLVGGPYAETGLGQAFREARAATQAATTIVVDFSHYEPSGGVPAMFVASPVYDEGEFVGVLATQIGAAAVNEVMDFTAGMGETGETYAVGQDRLMRSDSRFTDRSDVLQLTVETESVARALEGGRGVHRILDYRYEEVISAYGLLDSQGLRWAIIAEKDVAEIFAPARRLRRMLLLTGLIVVLLVALAAIPDRKKTDWLHAPDLAQPESSSAA